MTRFWWMAMFGVLLSVGTHAAAADAETARLIHELGLKEGRQPVGESEHWRKPRRIVVLLEERQLKSKPDAEKWLKAVAGDAELRIASSREEMVKLLAGADALLGYCTDETLEHGESLRWIQNYAAGVEKCAASPHARKRTLLVTNMQRIYGPGIAEHVIAMTYMLARRLYVFHDLQRERKYDRRAVDRTSMWELQGRTMLVVGLGGIGTEIARRAHALGMRVIATRASSREKPAFVDDVGLPDELHRLAKQADVVVNATPLTPQTTGLFNRRFFDVMKPGAFFINVGRGRSVVTADLIAALNAGRLGGAALDVQDPEPLPSEHPLWTAKNVVITPHISASSDEQMNRFWFVLRENLRRYVAGERMLNVVDLERGY